MQPRVTARWTKVLQPFLADWKYRYAGLMTLSSTAEGAHKQMEAYLDQMVDGIVGFLKDPHPRVRYAACNCIGQMATDFAPTFQKKYHTKVIPGLLMILDDDMNPRVQAHGGAALVNFAEDSPKNILINQLDHILSKLLDVLNKKVQEVSVEDFFVFCFSFTNQHDLTIFNSIHSSSASRRSSCWSRSSRPSPPSPIPLRTSSSRTTTDSWPSSSFCSCTPPRPSIVC